MEGGAATVVTFLIEAAARAGARDGPITISIAASGAAGIAGGGIKRPGGGTYFDRTVDFVAGVAQEGLDRAREVKARTGGSDEAEDREEACLTLLQGLIGFARSGYV